jgi:stage III sporulation protein AH
VKNIFRKNQIIITALAIMIAVAGYLNYAQKNAGEETMANVENELTDNDVADISDEDILAQAQDTSSSTENNSEAQEEGETESSAVETAGEDIQSNDLDLTDGNTEQPGEAVLTNTAGVDMIAEARLTREQTRAKNKETLLELINNTNITEAQKQEAIDNMIRLTSLAEKESAAEILLEAKGFTDTVVSITDNSVDVVVNLTEITDAQRAQIEDIVKRKTEMSAENIIITPIKGNN